MRKKKLTVLGALVTVLLVGFASSSFSVVLAKNVNVPEGETIFYWSGGNTTINVPATFHWPTAKIGILATDNVGGNAGTGDSLLLTLIVPVTGFPAPVTFPFALITTNPIAAVVQRAVFSGTPIYIHKTDSNGVMRTLENIFPVSEEELKVERHGNSITVDFDPKDTITLQFPNTPYWPKDYVTSIPNPSPPPATIPYTVKPALYPLILPAFHLEFEKYGGSTHFTDSKTFVTTNPDIVLSGYTLSFEDMGFYADATFTCPTWPAAVKEQTAHDAFVTMHGITTVIPPPPA